SKGQTLFEAAPWFDPPRHSITHTRLTDSPFLPTSSASLTSGFSSPLVSVLRRWTVSFCRRSSSSSANVLTTRAHDFAPLVIHTRLAGEQLDSHVLLRARMLLSEQSSADSP
ncbi:hypothetical protein A4X03_0g9239, partial [Tilletia caries]